MTLHAVWNLNLTTAQRKSLPMCLVSLIKHNSSQGSKMNSSRIPRLMPHTNQVINPVSARNLPGPNKWSTKFNSSKVKNLLPILTSLSMSWSELSKCVTPVVALSVKMKKLSTQDSFNKPLLTAKTLVCSQFVSNATLSKSSFSITFSIVTYWINREVNVLRSVMMTRQQSKVTCQPPKSSIVAQCSKTQRNSPNSEHLPRRTEPLSTTSLIFPHNPKHCKILQTYTT